MSRRRRAVIFFAILIVAALGDQGTKAWARTLPTHPANCSTEAMVAHRCSGVPQPVIDGYWDWELAFNDGAAFSNFRGKAVVLSLIAMGALVMLGVMASRTKPDQGLKRTALALIAGGALGNLIDRLRDGAVVDFVHWHAREHEYPIFNVADVVLIVGVGLLIIEGMLAKRAAARERPA